MCEDMSSPVGESVDTTYLQYSVKKRAKEMARYQGAEIYYYSIKEDLLTEYQLEIKQIVEYPRCRVQKKFVEMLMCDPDIKTSGGC